MNCLTQFIILARRNGTEGWMDILVLVVIAVVYGLGALIKAKSKKAEDQDQPRKPQKKPATGGRGLLEKFIMDVQKAAEEAKSGKQSPQSSQKVHQQATHPQAAVRKYASVTKQVKHTLPSSIPVKTKLSKPTPHAQSDFEILPELDTDIRVLPKFKSQAVVGLPGKRKQKPAEVVNSMYLSDVLTDYEDPEELKKAILHYEILGKPIALRDPSRDII